MRAQPVAQRREWLRRGRERDRPLDVGLGGLDDQLRQADRVQQAGRHAPGEGASPLREHREPHPERIAGRRAGVVGQGVQEQVGRGEPGEVVLARAAPREDQPLRREADRRRFAAQAVDGLVFLGQQPQHGVRHARQDPAPGAEHGRGQLGRVVEAAQHDRARRQAERAPVGRGGPRSLAIVGLVGRQHQQAFVEAGAGVGVDEARVRDEVVVGARARRAEIAQVEHLHRCDAAGEQRDAATLGVAGEVDRDVDGQLAAQRRHPFVAPAADVEEGIGGRAQPLLHRVVLRLAMVDQRDVEDLAVVQLQRFRQQEGHWMGMEVAGNVGDADLASGREARPHRRRRGTGRRVPGPGPCRRLLQRRVVRQVLDDQRLRDRLATSHLGEQRIATRVEVAPVVDMHRRVEPQSGEPRGVRREPQSRVEVIHRQREPARAQMEIGPVLQRRGEVRIMTNRGAEGVERLGLPAALAQRHAHQVARDRMARRLGTDGRQRRQRVAPAARVDQLLRALEAEVVAGGIGGDGQLDRHQRRVAGAQVPVAQAQAMEGTGVSGVPRGGLLERRDRLLEPAGLAQRDAPVVEQRGAGAGRLRQRTVLGLRGDPVAAVGEGMRACQRRGRA